VCSPVVDVLCLDIDRCMNESALETIAPHFLCGMWMHNINWHLLTYLPLYVVIRLLINWSSIVACLTELTVRTCFKDISRAPQICQHFSERCFVHCRCQQTTCLGVGNSCRSSGDGCVCTVLLLSYLNSVQWRCYLVVDLEP